MRAVLLDRDGTIIYDKHYLHDPDEVELLPEAVRGLQSMAAMGFKLIVVSNQSGVGRGFFTLKDVEACNNQLYKLLQKQGVFLDAFFVCPHAPQEQCPCRKPLSGLALQAQKRFGLDFKHCAVIGDKKSDVELGKAIGARSILVTTGKGATALEQCEPEYTAKNLSFAADWLATQFPV